MIKTENPNGYIEITNEYFAALVGAAASSCFGVAGMADTNAYQSLRSVIKKRQNKEMPERGVSVRQDGEGLVIDLHIAVSYGVNIGAIVESIRNKVRYTVQEATELKVSRVNIYVDQMKD